MKTAIRDRPSAVRLQHSNYQSHLIFCHFTNQLPSFLHMSCIGIALYLPINDPFRLKNIHPNW